MRYSPNNIYTIIYGKILLYDKRQNKRFYPHAKTLSILFNKVKEVKESH